MPKRIFDILASTVGLLVLWPLMVALALTIKATSKGPALYLGDRVGRHGKPFRIMKFRSMVMDAERLGGSSTASDDTRITRVGHLMRKFKLDELPQLMNVLTGTMSLVGPRPEVQKFVDLYTPEERIILSIRPGITDWASIWNSDEGHVLDGAPDADAAYAELIRPTKLELQKHYAVTSCLATDIRIIFATFAKLIRPEWQPKELKAYGRPRTWKELNSRGDLVSRRPSRAA